MINQITVTKKFEPSIEKYINEEIAKCGENDFVRKAALEEILSKGVIEDLNTSYASNLVNPLFDKIKEKDGRISDKDYTLVTDAVVDVVKKMEEKPKIKITKIGKPTIKITKTTGDRVFQITKKFKPRVENYINEEIAKCGENDFVRKAALEEILNMGEVKDFTSHMFSGLIYSIFNKIKERDDRISDKDYDLVTNVMIDVVKKMEEKIKIIKK